MFLASGNFGASGDLLAKNPFAENPSSHPIDAASSWRGEQPPILRASFTSKLGTGLPLVASIWAWTSGCASGDQLGRSPRSS